MAEKISRIHGFALGFPQIPPTFGAPKPQLIIKWIRNAHLLVVENSMDFCCLGGGMGNVNFVSIIQHSFTSEKHMYLNTHEIPMHSTHIKVDLMFMLSSSAGIHKSLF